MPTKSNNIGGRGGARIGAGRKKSAIKEKAQNGNPGGRTLETLDIPEIEGAEMPKPHEFLSEKQRDGNDYSFERVFARQLEAKAKPGDMLIGLSTSGTSKNVLEALRYARKNGITTVLLMGGFQPPQLEERADHIICVPSRITPRIQEAHIFIGHVIAEYVEHTMFKKS